MSKRIIEKNRDIVKNGNHDMTFHANEEMTEDFLNILDIEAALFF